MLYIKKLYHLANINSSIHDVTPLPNKTGIQSIFLNYMDHELFQNFKHHNLKVEISSTVHCLNIPCLNSTDLLKSKKSGV